MSAARNLTTDSGEARLGHFADAGQRFTVLVRKQRWLRNLIDLCQTAWQNVSARQRRLPDRRTRVHALEWIFARFE